MSILFLFALSAVLASATPIIDEPTRKKTGQRLRIRTFMPTSMCSTRAQRDLEFATTAFGIGFDVQSCYTNKPFPQQIHTNFPTQELIASLGQAGAFDDDPDLTVVLYVQEIIHPTDIVKGWYWGGRFVFISIKDGDELTLAHELGHRLGLLDCDIPSHVMCCGDGTERFRPSSPSQILSGIAGGFDDVEWQMLHRHAIFQRPQQEVVQAALRNIQEFTSPLQLNFAPDALPNKSDFVGNPTFWAPTRVSEAEIPEPGTFTLLGLGLGLVASRMLTSKRNGEAALLARNRVRTVITGTPSASRSSQEAANCPGSRIC